MRVLVDGVSVDIPNFPLNKIRPKNDAMRRVQLGSEAEGMLSNVFNFWDKPL